MEVGNIFQLGTRFSDTLGCTFLDKDGQKKPVIMGSYGIGVGRLLACVAEEHHDEQGLVWPASLAPYDIHLVALLGKARDSRQAEVAEQLYLELTAAGFEVLLDDREESPGVKFNDADLIGLPLRVTVSERGLNQGAVELKRRDREERELIPLGELVTRLQKELREMKAAIEATLVTEEYCREQSAG